MDLAKHSADDQQAGHFHSTSPPVSFIGVRLAWWSDVSQPLPAPLDSPTHPRQSPNKSIACFILSWLLAF